MSCIISNDVRTTLDPFRFSMNANLKSLLLIAPSPSPFLHDFPLVTLLLHMHTHMCDGTISDIVPIGNLLEGRNYSE